MSKNRDTNLARGLNCLERHQSVKPHKLPWLLCGYSEIVGGSCGVSSDNSAECPVCYLLLINSERGPYWENIARGRTTKTEGNILSVRSQASESLIKAVYYMAVPNTLLLEK